MMLIEVYVGLVLTTVTKYVKFNINSELMLLPTTPIAYDVVLPLLHVLSL